MRYTRTLIVAGLLACGTAYGATNGTGPVPVLSGGVGLGARQELAEQARDYNLKLVFALVSREYLSDVDVAISNASGHEVATHRSDGPWMFAKLPAGDYTVRATVNGKTLTKKVSVGKQGQKEVNFLWPDSTGTMNTTGTDAAAR